MKLDRITDGELSILQVLWEARGDQSGDYYHAARGCDGPGDGVDPEANRAAA